LKIFGFEFRRIDKEADRWPSFVAPTADDGALTVTASAFAAQYLDLEGTVRTESELITRYRTMALQPEIARAVDEISSEAVTRDEDGEVVKVFLDKIKISPNLKKLVEVEFDNILKLLKFNHRYFDIFKRWYIDGRLYYHAIIDDTKPEEGLQELRYIDPRKIKKVREVIRRRGNIGISAALVQTKNEYYVYNDRGFGMNLKFPGPAATSGMRIAKDAIVYTTSGLTDTAGTMVLSYLHPAIKPLNELRTLEDATVIYRLSRAPERRVWYIDVGQLPKMKAEQYVRDIMVKHKNKLVYDSATGEIKDDRRFMTMLEDYWLPRREGGRGTQVDTLKGGENLGKMEDVEHFQKKLWEALNVPVSRLEPDNALIIGGRPLQITREELKFHMFIDRLKQRFAILFTDLLEKQLVLKKIFSIEEFQVFRDDLEYEFAENSYFAELKEQEILMQRMSVLQLMEPYIGRYYSNEYIRKEILKQDDGDMEKIDEEIALEQQSYQYLPTEQKQMLQQQEQQQQLMQQQAGMDQQQQDQMAASPEGQAQAVVDQAKDQPPDTLQGISQYKRSQKFLSSNQQ
jgi:hypothetical protein